MAAYISHLLEWPKFCILVLWRVGLKAQIIALELCKNSLLPASKNAEVSVFNPLNFLSHCAEVGSDQCNSILNLMYTNNYHMSTYASWFCTQENLKILSAAISSLENSTRNLINNHTKRYPMSGVIPPAKSS
jgi:hypothetical protein